MTPTLLTEDELLSQLPALAPVLRLDVWRDADDLLAQLPAFANMERFRA
jgi:hypothetical protein